MNYDEHGINIAEVQVFAEGPNGQLIPCHWQIVPIWETTKHQDFGYKIKVIAGYKRGELLSPAGPVADCVPIIIYHKNTEAALTTALEYKSILRTPSSTGKTRFHYITLEPIIYHKDATETP